MFGSKCTSQMWASLHPDVGNPSNRKNVDILSSTCVNDSCLTSMMKALLGSRVSCISHVPRVIESCLIYERVMSHIWISHVGYVLHVNKAGRTRLSEVLLASRVSCISHVTCVNMSCFRCVSESCPAYVNEALPGIQRIMHQPCHTFERGMFDKNRALNPNQCTIFTKHPSEPNVWSDIGFRSVFTKYRASVKILNND